MNAPAATPLGDCRLYGTRLENRLLLGTARFPSLAVLREAIEASGTEVVTVAVRRAAAGEDAGEVFWRMLKESGVRVLPNTAGCHSAREAVTTALMARELFDCSWVKLEVVQDDHELKPNAAELPQAPANCPTKGLRCFRTAPRIAIWPRRCSMPVARC